LSHINTLRVEREEVKAGQNNDGRHFLKLKK
jgi:hypothetical protein